MTLAALATVVVILAPRNPQCDDVVYARANPGQCQLFPDLFPDIPSGGGHPGGILGTIGGILHSIGL